jgi:cytochrome b involved in lipid metabolism
MEPKNNLQRNIGIILSVLVLLGVFSVTIVFGKKPSIPITAQASQISSFAISQNQKTPASAPKKSTPTPAPTTPSYTIAQVATHSNASSCWSAIGAGVYDLTSWINNHPGGAQAILSICGKDGTSAFNNQHGGQSRPAQELAAFFIGNYKK